MPSPAVTVLLPAYNERRFLPEAVRSILGQTWSDFELLVIDDGSTDSCCDCLGDLPDPRLRVLRNRHNLGITASLNRGLEAARGKYIARMDGDDVAEPHRLAAQVAFLEYHAEVGIVGSTRTLIDEQGRSVGISRPPTDDLSIRWKCLLGSPFGHPTVMLRRSILVRHGLRYREVRRAEDYDLWPRLLAVTRGANMDEPLIQYRLRPSVANNYVAQLAQHDTIALSAIQQMAPEFPVTPEDIPQLRGRYGGFSVRDLNLRADDPLWIARYCKLFDAFIAAHVNLAGIEAFAARQRAAIMQSAAA